jgi:translation initiation factor 4E
MLPGRLQSTLSESSDSSLNIMPPAAVAHGEPPKFTKDSKDVVSITPRSASPTRSQVVTGKSPLSAASSQGVAESIKSASTPSTTREMPSLQDIIDRMSKKGISSSSSSKDLAGSVNEELATKSDKTAPASVSPAAVKSSPPAQPVSIATAATAQKAKAEAEKPVEEKKDKGHPLQHKWTMYFDSKSWNPSTSASADTPGSPLVSSSTPANSWEAALKMLGIYTTVESFMSIFSTLRRPSQLERNSNYHLFKDGIKPMWEDAANQNGGKWIITLKGTNTALLDRSWMWLVLALIGEELDDNDDVTGAVVSTRSKGDRIALWIRNKNDVDLVNKIG